MMRLIALLALLAMGAAPPQTRVDLLIKNGPIFSAETDHRVYRAVAIKDGRIVAVGDENLARRYRADRVIDLKGRMAMPGFNDAHSHIRGRPRRFVELSDVTSIATLKARIAERAALLGPGEWITGYGWSEDRLAEKRKPTRLDLDAAAPGNPVYLDREGGHSAVVNSRVLALAGLSATSKDPPGGTLEHLPDGSLSGVIREQRTMVTRLLPGSDPAELREDLGRRLNDLFRLGITSVTDASTSPREFQTMWKPLYAAGGRPLPRSTVQINPNLPDVGPERAMAALASVQGVTGTGDELLRVGAVKVFVDGGFTGPAAWTTRGYRNDPNYHGHAAVDMAALERFSEAAHRAGWQLGYHAIGDAAIERAVGVFDRILKAAPRPDHRHHLNHFTVLPGETTLATMARRGIGIIQQPNFTYSLEGRYRTYLPTETLARNNAVATPLRHQIAMAFSSDIVPIGPMVGIYGAVARKGESGTLYAADEMITVMEALRLYTAGGAWMNFNERRLGRIAPGLWADIIVLDRDLLRARQSEILDTKVDLTLLGGRIVYQRTGSEPKQ